MQYEQYRQKREKIAKKVQEIFLRKRAEAFRHFMQAHFDDPLFKETVLEFYF